MNNDDIIILNSYPDTVERITILKNSLLQFKKTNKEVLLATHHPVDIEIQQLADYFIYDKRNQMLDQSMLNWYKNGKFYFQSCSGDLGRASYAGLLSIQNAICFAKDLGKKLVYYFEYDCLISDYDLKRIDLLKNEIYKKGKRGYVRLDTHGRDMLNKGVTTLFFIIEVDFFFENFNIMKSPSEYKNNVNHSIALEFYFYQGLSKNLSQLEVVESDYLKENFPNSEFNLSSFESSHFIDILPEKITRKLVLAITNPKDITKEYKILFLEDDENNISEDVVILTKEAYYYNILLEKVKRVKIFYKENGNWKLVYNKKPYTEIKNKNEVEYVRFDHE